MIEGLRAWRRETWAFNTEHRRQWVAEQASTLPSGSRVLDAGAGVGQFRPLFAHCDYRTQDFGLEPATLGNYTALDYQCDITSIPAPDESFDAVLCTEVLEHVPDPAGALRELVRLLKPGGRLMLSAPLSSHLHQEPYHYYGGYTPHWYRRVLHQEGCDITAIERNGGFFRFFGQEALRFSDLLRPRHTGSVPLVPRLVLSAIWGLTLPLFHLLPVVGAIADRYRLEQIATVGYHVVAIKRASSDG